MFDEIGIIGFILVLINFVFTYRGLTNSSFQERYKFEVDAILISKQYERLITSGFLHVNWLHFIFNMVALLAFSSVLEMQIGIFNFLIIYFASLIGGDLLSLFVHRNHGNYSAVGASGAVFGIVFAYIVCFPNADIGLFLIPFEIPGWIFALLMIAMSIYGIKSNKSNIGHDAHLGGALIGVLTTILIFPKILLANYIFILAITIPAIVFIYLIVTKPHLLLIDNFYYNNNKKYFSIEQKYHDTKANQQKELDKLLDKISAKGIESLSKSEKEKLNKLSGR